jgi:hypothetical protein
VSVVCRPRGRDTELKYYGRVAGEEAPGLYFFFVSNVQITKCAGSGSLCCGRGRREVDS